MELVIRALADNPLLLLFTVCAIGYPLGRVRIGGVSLGTASVLFVGLAIGAVDSRLKLPDIVYLFGLTLFIYTIGLSSATGFFKGFDRRGLRNTALALGVLTLAGVLDYAIARAANLTGATGSAMYSGAFTNASGLAGVVEAVKSAGGTGKALSEPVVGYSLAYPLGIFGPILVMLVAEKLFRVDLRKEALEIPSYRRSIQKIEVRTVEVMNPGAEAVTIADLAAGEARDVVFGRVVRDGEFLLAHAGLKLRVGDRIAVTGPGAELDSLTAHLGRISSEEIHLDRTEFDVRRIFVSNPTIAGRPLRDLALTKTHHAVITRVGRGDIDLIPGGDTILELGDRVRVLARRDEMPRLRDFFGDSYRALSDIDFRTLCMGILLGLILGLIPIPLPGGITFRLGFAGGPLVAALLLGRLERTGPFVWNLPYSANLTLRQLGLLLFAAGIGTRAGYDFYSTLSAGHGLNVFLGGAAMTFAAGLLTMVIGFKLLRIPLNLLFGIYAGAQTQPVNLSFAAERTGNDLPNAGYAAIFPLATIYKILIAQVLFNILR